MHTKLAEALRLLAINELSLLNDEGKKVPVSARDHAKALFIYLNMGNYLSDNLIKKAVNYLAVSAPFSADKENVKSDLIRVCQSSRRNGAFDPEIFITHFAKENYFTVNDIIELIVFLQQTAFDRQYGVERDQLPEKNWIRTCGKEFYEHAKLLAVVTPMPPQKPHYNGVAIMGAASSRLEKRIEYFRNLNAEYDYVWALSGDRELSKGLDDEELMAAVAAFVDKPVSYVERSNGVTQRVFLDGVTETMMVNYLIHNNCPLEKIGFVDSEVEEGHWRGTTAQNAVDLAKILIKKIQDNEIKNITNGRVNFLIIAEQPYSMRMAMPIQRQFNEEIRRENLEGQLAIEVEGCGPGIAEQNSQTYEVLSRLDSELGALMWERFIDARLAQGSRLQLRDPSLIMFASRDERFNELQPRIQSTPSRYP